MTGVLFVTLKTLSLDTLIPDLDRLFASKTFFARLLFSLVQ